MLKIIELEKLFPKYSFTQDTISYRKHNKFIHVRFRDYRWTLHIGRIFLRCTQDIYNSIDYVEDFLKSNEFVVDIYTFNIFRNIKLNIEIYKSLLL